MDRKTLPRWLFALAIGLALAWLVYERATDPQPLAQRQAEERAVLAAREQLIEVLSLPQSAEIVDPLAPNRVAGKVYVYPSSDGWEVSGFYRRQPDMEWLPWLMRLDAQVSMSLLRLSQSDPGVDALAADPRISVL